MRLTGLGIGVALGSLSLLLPDWSSRLSGINAGLAVLTLISLETMYCGD